MERATFVLDGQELDVARDDWGRLVAHVNGNRVAGPGQLFGSRLAWSFHDAGGRTVRVEITNHCWSDACALRVDGCSVNCAEMHADWSSIMFWLVWGLIGVAKHWPFAGGHSDTHGLIEHALFLIACYVLVASAAAGWARRRRFECASTDPTVVSKRLSSLSRTDAAN